MRSGVENIPTASHVASRRALWWASVMAPRRSNVVAPHTVDDLLVAGEVDSLLAACLVHNGRCRGFGR